ncbi:hypothetical protein BJX68DRAFT_262337 [Aspergillus pseudodeflectus]|uniref:NACHT domain-containing protein n=1 Tax=Aspergillus pseudodeflectus TaxID=176178 RepID=A0ABR4L2Q4_9EURO
MDALAAVGLASNIISFIDFSCELITGARDIYKSGDGRTSENATLESILVDLEDFSQGLITDLKATTSNEKALLRLSTDCLRLSQELSSVLAKLKASGGNRKWKSLRTKWASMRKERDISSMESRLSSYRGQILIRLQFMLGQQQSSFKASLDEIQMQAQTFHNVHGKQLDTLRTGLLAEIGRMRDTFQAVSQRESTDNGNNFGGISVTGLCALLAELRELTARVPAENQLLARLYFPSLYYREDAVAPSEAKTFQWLVDHVYDSEGMYKTSAEVWGSKGNTRRNFLKWLNSGDGIFHVSGKAGSGKSTLMKLLCDSPRVHDELQSWAGPRILVFARFFFWIGGDELQRSLQGLYRAILFDVLRQCPDLILRIFPESDSSPRCDPRIRHLPAFRQQEVEAAFLRLINLPDTSDYRICLFIDGLDEYQGDSVDYWTLAKNLNEWTKSGSVKMCVSSRPYTEFLQSFGICSEKQIHLHTLTETDIRGYCQAMMKKDPQFESIKADYQEFAEEIVRRARGVFLWARLATRSFLAGVGYHDSSHTLRQKLESIPDDVMALFDQMLDRVDSLNRLRAAKLLLIAVRLVSHQLPAIIFSWLDDLDNPHFPFQFQCERTLQDATRRVESVKRKLDSLTKGMLELQTSYNGIDDEHRVQFFHRSIYEYICDSKAHHLRQQVPNFNDQEACCRLLLGYLKWCRERDPDVREPLKFWSCQLKYFEILEDLKGSPTIRQYLDGFLRLSGNQPESPCLTIQGGHPLLISQPFPFRPLHPLCLILHYGHVQYVRDAILADTQLLHNSHVPRILLLISAIAGHSDLVRLLLQKGVSPHSNAPVLMPGNNRELKASLWIVILSGCAQEMLNNDTSTHARTIHEFLTLDPSLDHNVYFLIAHGRDGNMSFESTKKIVSLQGLLGLCNTPGSQELIRLIWWREKFNWWSRLGGIFSPAPSNDTTWSQLLSMKYEPLSLKFIGQGRKYKSNSIYSTHTWDEEFRAWRKLEVRK